MSAGEGRPISWPPFYIRDLVAVLRAEASIPPSPVQEGFQFLSLVSEGRMCFASGAIQALLPEVVSPLFLSKIRGGVLPCQRGMLVCNAPGTDVLSITDYQREQ